MDPNLSLADAQFAMGNLIDAYRLSLTNGYFTWNGVQWDCNEISKGNVIGACVLMLANGGAAPTGFVWRDESNVDHPMTGPQMLGMGIQMFTFLSACYGASWKHKANMLALTDVASVEAYDYTSTLWPNPNA